MRALDRLWRVAPRRMWASVGARCRGPSAYQRSRPKRGGREDDQQSRAVVGYTTHRRSACGFYLVALKGGQYTVVRCDFHTQVCTNCEQGTRRIARRRFRRRRPDGSAMIAIGPEGSLKSFAMAARRERRSNYATQIGDKFPNRAPNNVMWAATFGRPASGRKLRIPNKD